MDRKREIIERIFYDLERGFGSQAETLRLAKAEDPSIKIEDVRKVLSEQKLNQRRPVKRYNSYVPTAPRERVEMDLVEYKGSRYRYGLVGVEIFTKKLAVVPIASKTSALVARALDIVLERLQVPGEVLTDIGGEFQGEFRKRLEEHYSIDHLTSRSGGVFVEPAIRTIREGVRKRLIALEMPLEDWWKVVDFVVRKYNNTVQTTTKEKPNDVEKLSRLKEEDREEIGEIKERMESKARSNRRYPPLEVGDTVRLQVKPGKFAEYKEGFVTWSERLYRVASVRTDKGATQYMLEGWREPVLRHNLLKVTGVRVPNLSAQRARIEGRFRRREA